MQEIIILACTKCKNRNYNSTKNKRNVTGKLEISKYCSSCKKHTKHRETK